VCSISEEMETEAEPLRPFSVLAGLAVELTGQCSDASFRIIAKLCLDGDAMAAFGPRFRPFMDPGHPCVEGGPLPATRLVESESRRPCPVFPVQFTCGLHVCQLPHVQSSCDNGCTWALGFPTYGHAVLQTEGWHAHACVTVLAPLSMVQVCAGLAPGCHIVRLGVATVSVGRCVFLVSKPQSAAGRALLKPAYRRNEAAGCTARGSIPWP